MPVPAASAATPPPISATSHESWAAPSAAPRSNAPSSRRAWRGERSGDIFLADSSIGRLPDTAGGAARRRLGRRLIKARLEAALAGHPIVHLEHLLRLGVPGKVLDRTLVRGARVAQPQLPIVDIALQH